MKAWGDRLRFSISRSRLPQKTIAKHLGVSPAAITKWLAGGNIRYETLRALAAYLRVNWVWLRWGDEALDSASLDRRGRDARAEHRRAELSASAASDEDHHSAFCTAINVGVWSLNLQTNSLYYSPAMRDMFGLSPSDPIDRETFYRLIVPDDMPPGGGYVTDLFIKRLPLSFYSFRLKVDPDRWMLLIGKPIRNPAGEITHVCGAVHHSDNADLTAIVEFIKHFNTPPVNHID